MPRDRARACRVWHELTERVCVSGRGPSCSAERVRVRGCMSEVGRGLNTLSLRKRGEERGDEVGLVLVRLTIEAWRIGGGEAGEIHAFTSVAVALMWSGDEVTRVCGLLAVEACMNEMALGELAGELDARRKEWSTLDLKVTTAA